MPIKTRASGLSVLRFLPAVLFPLLFGLPSAAGATRLVQVTPQSKMDYVRLMQSAAELATCGTTVRGDAVEFAADDAEIARLASLGFTVDVLIDDLETYYRHGIVTSGDFGAYHTYTEAIQAMDSLAAAHPDIMSPKQSMGTTIEGRTIWVYKISDNPGTDENEPDVFFNAYIHAREPIGFEIVWDLARTLVNGYGIDPRMTNLVNTRQIWIEPVVNPDGVEYNRLTNPGGGGMWRKNRRHNQDGSYGVDLNRNFSYQWGYDNNGSSPWGNDETYRGTGPFSEPETAAMRDFLASRHCQTALNYHAFAGQHIFAWGYDDLHPADYDVLFPLARMLHANSGYGAGATWEQMYNTNGDACDWMYGDQVTKPKIFGLLTEAGNGNDGFWPPESRIPAIVAENHENNLRLCELADDPYRILPPAPSAVTSPDTVGTSFTLTWTVPQPDPDNPATAWNLIEATSGGIGADNLEGANQNRWSTDGWTWTNARYHSSNHSYWGGNTDGRNNVLTSRRGHLVRSGEQLKLWTWYSIENGWDYGYVEIATDARHYVALPGSITTNSDPNNRNIGNGITGNSAGWVQATFSLSSYVGQVVWVRFRYSTDGYTTGEGWYVDDIEPSDLFLTETTVATNLPVPHYDFVNHPTGTFSYLVQSVDAEGDLAIWGAPENILVTGTSGLARGNGNAPWTGLRLAQGNPFSDGAWLRYSIPASAREGEPVRLAVFDTGGRQVAEIRSGTVGTTDPPGTWYQDRWTPSGLPSGLYFARLTVGGRTSTERLVYMK